MGTSRSASEPCPDLSLGATRGGMSGECGMRGRTPSPVSATCPADWHFNFRGGPSRRGYRRRPGGRTAPRRSREMTEATLGRKQRNRAVQKKNWGRRGAHRISLSCSYARERISAATSIFRRLPAEVPVPLLRRGPPRRRPESLLLSSSSMSSSAGRGGRSDSDMAAAHGRVFLDSRIQPPSQATLPP